MVLLRLALASYVTFPDVNLTARARTEIQSLLAAPGEPSQDDRRYEAWRAHLLAWARATANPVGKVFLDALSPPSPRPTASPEAAMAYRLWAASVVNDSSCPTLWR